MIMSGPLASAQRLQRPKDHLANLIRCLDVVLLNLALLKDGIDKVFDKQGGRRSSQEALPGGHVQGFGTGLSNGKARYCIAVKADRYGLVDPVRPRIGFEDPCALQRPAKTHAPSQMRLPT